MVSVIPEPNDNNDDSGGPREPCRTYYPTRRGIHGSAPSIDEE